MKDDKDASCHRDDLRMEVLYVEDMKNHNISLYELILWHLYQFSWIQKIMGMPTDFIF